MALPVVYSADQVFQRFVQKITIYCFVGFLQSPFSSIDTGRQIFLRWLILALLEQVLEGGGLAGV